MKEKNIYHLLDPTWCRGCGLFGVFEALKRAAAALGLEPEETVIVTGIGCHGRLNNYFYSYGFHGLHGRTLPVAAGVKLTNPRLQVIAVSGDGDAYSIGAGHFIHALRKNVGITTIVVNNRTYALTQGQASPTTDPGMVTISTPFGSKDFPIEGPTVGLAAGGTFIARGFSGEISHLTTLLQKALTHKGFALVDILSPCVTHNKVNTYEWYRRNIVIAEKESDYDPEDKNKAWRLLAQPEKIAVGLIYQEEKPTLEDLLLPDKERPVAFNDLTVSASRLEKIIENFR